MLFRSARKVPQNYAIPQARHPTALVEDPQRMWRTPNTRGGEQAGYADMEKLQARWASGKQVQLCDQVRMWPTPTASTPTSPTAPWKPDVPWWKQSRAARHLAALVENPERMWPTPTSSLGTHAGLVTPSKAREGGTLVEAIAARTEWPTPTARAWKDNGESPAELARNSPTLAVAAGGQLNPTWVEWLMWFPLEWTVCEPSATRSSRKYRKSSGAQS